MSWTGRPTANSRAEHRSAGLFVAIVAVTGLTAMTAGATPVSGPRGNPSTTASTARLTLSSKFSSPPAEFSRPSASKFSPRPISAADYQFCLKTAGPGAVLVPVTLDMTGYSNEQKQDGSVPTGYPTPGFLTGSSTDTVGGVDPNGERFSCAEARVNLDYHGKPELPPITATFRSFGFVPVTATVVLEQQQDKGTPDPLLAVLYEDVGNIHQKFSRNFHSPWTAVVTASLILRVTSLMVNGTRLDIGPSCRTNGVLSTPGNPVSPGQLMLSGGGFPGDPVPLFADLQLEGAVAGLASIPTFIGCVTPSGENLDALLNATVSGPGNYVAANETPPCINLNTCRANNMPPDPPPLYSITHGRRFTASSGLSIFDSFGNTILTCATSKISGVIPNSFGPVRGPTATVQWDEISGCAGGGDQYDVIPQSSSLFSGNYFCDAAAEQPPPCTDASPSLNAFIGNISDASFLVKNETTGCQAEMSGYIPGAYVNGGVLEAFSDPGDGFLVISSTNCPELPLYENSGRDFGISARYQLEPSGATIRPIIP